jgi:hypothetical protein
MNEVDRESSVVPPWCGITRVRMKGWSPTHVGGVTATVPGPLGTLPLSKGSRVGGKRGSTEITKEMGSILRSTTVVRHYLRAD